MLKIRVLSALALLLISLPAKAIDLTAFGGLNYAAPTQTQSGSEVHWTGEAGFSYGLTAAVPIFLLPFEIETGFFMINDNSNRPGAGTGSAVIRKTRMLQIPLVVRFNFDEHIGIGMGGYIGLAQGEIETSANGVTGTTSYESALENRTDAGLIVNVRARFNLAPPLYFVLDARYQHGLMNRTLVANDIYNTRSVQAFVGLQFALLSSHDDDDRPAPRARSRD